MAQGFRELDLEAALGFESVSLEERHTNLALGGGSIGGNYVGRFNQETADEVRPLLQNRLENQEDQDHLIYLGIQSVKEKHMKINAKRPPKPPRPPKGPSLDVSDLKLIRELSELALEKRKRIKWLKDVKKMRDFKAASPSSSNSTSVALIITVLFCLIMLFQGPCSRSCSVVSLQSSPGPIQSPSGEDIISIQVLNNLSPSNDGNGFSSKTKQSSNPAIEEGLTRDS
uniref:Uncharacterized protein n=1 Tax=Kalanchoe fedtschenkoi TaxID=63787 RepID=A0A7N0T9P8_KALFE